MHLRHRVAIASLANLCGKSKIFTLVQIETVEKLQMLSRELAGWPQRRRAEVLESL